MHCAYSVLHVNALDPVRRTIRGIASTPQPDRRGDILDPLGATFQNPVPLLWHHDGKQPVGTATLEATAAGVLFEATFADVGTPGPLKDRIDEAWQSVSATPPLIRGVSVGFRPLRNGVKFLKDGAHFTATEIVELSLVTVPANVDATILAIKSYDAPHLAASGTHPSGVPDRPIVHTSMATQTTSEQITGFENTRATKVAALLALQKSVADAGRTKDAAEKSQFDDLNLEIKSLDSELADLYDAQRFEVAAAKPLVTTTSKALELTTTSRPMITVKANVAPGTAFVRYCQAMAVSRGSRLEAQEYAKQWRDSTPEVELILKAAVAPGTTTDATWAGPLAPMKNLTDEFLELLRPATVLGRIPGLRRVPFNISIASQTAGGTYQWVGQGAPKPVGKLAFSAVTLGITKCAGIIVITEELARTSSPSAEATIRADMIAGIAQFLDLEFTDPAKAPVANISPGSITNGVTPITSTGTTPANARADLQALVAAINAAGISTATVVILMSEANAMALGFSLNPLGQPLFPNIGMSGGTALGMTIVTSNALGAHIIALDPNSILLADEGGVTIDASREASVQMDSAPDNPASATTVLTSFWQNNLIGLRAERFINWKKARTGSVQFTNQTYVG
jgi:HK97 family phage major capsid protein